MAENLQPGTITTLGALRPGDVGEFEGIYTTLFVMTESGRCEWADGSWQWFNPDIPVIYRGRGKIAPAVPARIVMDGETDRIAELEEQVRTLREMINRSVTTFDRLDDEQQATAREPKWWLEWSQVAREGRAALAATAPKGGEAMTPSDTLTHRAATYLSILNDAARRREGAQLIEQLLARVRELEAGLTWTDAKPTVPGWYWWRAPYSHPEMIHLFRITEDSPLVMDRRNGTYMAPGVGQFAGPIPQPEEPR